jgi:sugar lactone lactonase YvrE
VLCGEIVERIPMPGLWPLVCALGGDDRRALYMLVAEPPGDGDPRAVESGFIEVTRVDVPGDGWP